MQTIYLAGPIAQCTPEEMHGWREEVKSELAGLYSFKDPTDRLNAPPNEIVEGDKKDIIESDIVLANYWKIGTGTAMEIMFTHMVDRRRLMLTVVHGNYGEPVSPWIKIHSDHIFRGLDKAIVYLKNNSTTF
jgi:hypothetical protein